MDTPIEVGQCWRDVSDTLEAGMQRVLLYGPPGTGKTYAALHTAVDSPVERLVCTEDMSSGDVMGTWMPASASEWIFHEGPAMRAWRGEGGLGSRLVIDEVERASGEALSMLLSVTDSSESQSWRNPATLETLRPGPNFSVVLTSNAESLSEIPEALLDRFPVAIYIDQPHPSALVYLSEDLRGPAIAGSFGPSTRRVSLRRFYALDQLRRRHGLARATELIFRDKASDVLDALTIGGVRG